MRWRIVVALILVSAGGLECAEQEEDEFAEFEEEFEFDSPSSERVADDEEGIGCAILVT